jgi:hypothetical protein
MPEGTKNQQINKLALLRRRVGKINLGFVRDLGVEETELIWKFAIGTIFGFSDLELLDLEKICKNFETGQVN